VVDVVPGVEPVGVCKETRVEEHDLLRSACIRYTYYGAIIIPTIPFIDDNKTKKTIGLVLICRLVGLVGLVGQSIFLYVSKIYFLVRPCRWQHFRLFATLSLSLENILYVATGTCTGTSRARTNQSICMTVFLLL